MLFSSIILPILPSITVAQTGTVVHKRSASALIGDWDPAITDWYNVMGSYMYYALEYPVNIPIYYHGGIGVPRKDEYIWGLATDVEFEAWPLDNNTSGFNSTGGYKSATFTLREGVTFTDGSAWNATAFKWNIDRVCLINGNYSGDAIAPWDEEEGNLMHTIPVEDYKAYWSSTWNMSIYDSPNLGITEPTTLPVVRDYAWYDLGPNRSLVEYPGLTVFPNGSVQNQNPYGGWDTVAGAAIHWAPYDRYPIVKYVEILENPASGGKIKVHYNSWNTGGMDGPVNYPMVSYHTYKDDHTVHGIYGYQHDVLDTKNAEIIDHLVGTGPYIYEEHDETGTPPGGYMTKNPDYWNTTGLEAMGVYDVDRFEVIKFPAGELGRDAQNTALLTGAIDYAYDSMYMPLDYNAVQDNEGIDYFAQYSSEYKTNIVLNCINETWWAWPWADAWRMTQYPLAGNFSADGIPRALRQSMGYAFNYDLMIHTVLNDRAIRGGGALAVPNLYYNATLDDPEYLAYYNVTKAREILLTTEADTSGEVYTGMGAANGYWPDPDLYNFSKMCADRGLTAGSSDNEWQLVADTNPIFTVNFYWDSAHEDVKSVFLTSLENIGCTLTDTVGTTNRVTTIIWDTVRIGHLTTFDGDHSLFSCNAWVMDEHLPHDYPQLNLFWAHVDPDKGRWRTQGSAGISSWHFWGNYGFNFNADADYYNDRMWQSEPNERFGWISKLAEVEQTEVFPKLWLYEAKEGYALWNDWTVRPLVKDRAGNDAGLYGGASVQYLDYTYTPTEYPLIPGSPLFITLTVSAVSMIGIIYTIMRKKRIK